MGDRDIVHSVGNPICHLKRQKRVVAQDYPFYVISLWHCSCGCNSYNVTLDKVDIGYHKRINKIDYKSSLEAFVKFEKLVEECQSGAYDMLAPKEGEAFE